MKILLLVAAAAAASACNRASQPAPEQTSSATAPAPAGERKYLLEQVDDAGVIQLYADGFAALPLREKTLIYHLSRAAIAGREIFYDQKHRHGVEMKRVIEAIMSRPQAIEPGAFAEIQRYAKLFW